MKIRHSIKRTFQRMIIRSKRHTSQYNRNLKLDFESEVLQGCRNLIHTATTKLSICPDTGRKFVINDDIHFKMIISDDKITISNSVYYRELPISERGLVSINRVFNGHLRKAIAVLDSSIKQTSQHTLNDVTILTFYL